MQRACATRFQLILIVILIVILIHILIATDHSCSDARLQLTNAILGGLAHFTEP